VAEIRDKAALACLMLKELGHTSQEANMAKLEMIFCAMTWGLMNALLIAITLDAATPVRPAPAVQFASLTSAPVA
jgi:hypothetical protein